MPRQKRTDQTELPAISAASPPVDTQDMFPEICVSSASQGVRGETNITTGESSDRKNLKAPPIRDSDKVVVRLPDGMRDEIKLSAEASGRSTNAEIVLRLQQFTLKQGGAIEPPKENGLGVSPTLEQDNTVVTTDTLVGYSDDLEIVRAALDVFGREAAQALWRDLGLPMPPSRPPLQRQVSEAQMRVEEFLDECTIPDPLFRLASSELHVRYKQWMELQGQPSRDLPAFGRLLVKAGCKRRRSNGSFYLGLRLRGEA